MSGTSSILANLASVLYLGRVAESDGPEIRESILLLLDALGGQPLRIETSAGGLALNGRQVPRDVPGAGLVSERLLSHLVRVVSIPGGVEAADILGLARTLAGYPGAFASWHDLEKALGPATRITLTEGLPGQDYVHDEPKALRLSKAGSDSLETGDLYAAEDGGLIPMPLPSDLAVVPVALRPSGGPKEDHRKLERLLIRGRSAVDAGDWGATLTIAREFLQAEREAVNESSARLYRMELKRLISRKEISNIARLAAKGNRREEAVEVLQRLGAAATESLMDLLAESEALGERRGYYSALTRMADGNEIIVHHLTNPHWYVVRNAADLCGEMALAEAVPNLVGQVDNPDERVRRSVLGALIRIGGREVIEPIARSFRDPVPSVRQFVLGMIEGDWARSLAMPLMNMLQAEEHPDVIREILKALGRIGTPDAVMALRQVATGGMKRLKKKSRLQAIEALGLTGDAGSQSLEALAKDKDKEIAAAADWALGNVA